MKYSKEFIAKVKSTHPEHKELHKMVDEGLIKLGKYLLMSYLSDLSSGGTPKKLYNMWTEEINRATQEEKMQNHENL